MKTCDDKSEGKRLLIVHHKIFNFGHILWRKNLKFIYNNCMLLLYLFGFLLNFAKCIYPKKAKSRAK